MSVASSLVHNNYDATQAPVPRIGTRFDAPALYCEPAFSVCPV